MLIKTITATFFHQMEPVSPEFRAVPDIEPVLL